MINTLITRIKETNAPIVVGLDPMMKFIPGQIRRAAFSELGETLEGAAEAIWQYNKGLVDAIYDLIPAVKPQIAMYEQFGIPGMIAFKKTVDYCKEKGLVVIGDIKRGDIGSTSEAYAVGHLGKVQVGSKSYYGFDEDFATLAPYMGSDSINPFKKVCQEEKKGLFILVKTSNPSSGEFQDRIIDGRPLYEWVAEKVVEWGSDFMGDSYSYVGAVVGATYDGAKAVEARIGDIYYSTFAAAYNVAKADETITLLADIEATEVILLGKSVTINGNGHKVTSNATRVFRVTTANTDEEARELLKLFGAPFAKN